jgi:hypothetical protein
VCAISLPSSILEWLIGLWPMGRCEKLIAYA